MTSGSFMAIAENVDVSPSTPNTPLAVSTPEASRDLVGSQADVDAEGEVGALEPVAPTGEPQAATRRTRTRAALTL
jgi:hypothetical protein